MKRKIIKISEEKCTGCGLCIPGCPEGAIQLIDGKARLISDLFCDGLGACIGECPEGAIVIEEREAEPYDEHKVMENIIRQGPNVILAHLNHLREHGENEYLGQALALLKEKGLSNPLVNTAGSNKEVAACAPPGGCPGARSRELAARSAPDDDSAAGQPSRLSHWPVQLHLMSPAAPQYREKDVLLAADCVAYAIGDFHRTYLRGKSLAIACPKLDANQDVYIDKIQALIDQAAVKTLTVMIMEVPCCRGLLSLVRQACDRAARKITINSIVVGLDGVIRSG